MRQTENYEEMGNEEVVTEGMILLQEILMKNTPSAVQMKSVERE